MYYWNRSHRTTAILVSLTIGILAWLYFFERLLKPALHSFPGRSIGITVLSGIDANLRTLWYCISVVLLVVLIYGLFWLFTWIGKRISTVPGWSFSFRVELTCSRYLSFFALFLAVYGIARGDSFALSLSWSLLLFILLLYYHILVRVSFSGKHQEAGGYLRDYSLLTLSLSISLSFLFAGWAAWDMPLVFTREYLMCCFLFNLFFLPGIPVLLNITRFTPDQARVANLMASLPLLVLPAAMPVAWEIHFAISDRLNIQAVDFTRTVAGVIIFLAIILYFAGLIRKSGITTSVFSRVWLFPLLLAGFFICLEASNFLRFKTYDLFHYGERMLITQQMFSFGRIPFVDIIPTHGIMDFFGETLYSIVNGYRGPEMFLWQWIPVLAGILLMYFLLTRFMSPLFSLLLLIFTPESFTFNDSYRFCIIIPLVLIWVIRDPGFRRYLVLWFSVVLLFFWRYDYGIIAAITTLCLVPGVILVKSGGVISWPSLMRKAIPSNITMMISLSASAFLYGLILGLNGADPFGMFGQFYYYFKSQAPTQSFVDVYQGYSLLFLLEYVVSPVISVGYVLYYIHALLFRQGFNKTTHVLLAWLAIFSLVMTMRAIQRHTLTEEFNPGLSIFLLCAAPFYFLNPGRRLSHTIFLSTLMIYLLMLLAFPMLSFVSVNPVNIIPQGQLYDFRSVPQEGSRVVIKDSSQFRNLKRFLDTHLTKDQTFFDFTNAPLLYVLTDRLFPAHLIPNLYQASDPIEDFLIKRLDSLYTKNRLPLVLFRQNTFWDSIDGVPQPVRSYRVAEFIYRNYIPFTMVDNYEIWQDRKISNKMGDQNVFLIPFHDNKDVAIKDATIIHVDTDSLVVNTFGSDPLIFGILDLGKGLPLEAGKTYQVKLKYASTKPGKLQLFYAMNGQLFSEIMSNTIEVRDDQGIQEQSVILPSGKGKMSLTNVRIDPPSGASFSLLRPLISEADSMTLERTAPQHFDLRKLPYIWGNFDEKKASEVTRIIEDHPFDNQSIKPGEAFNIKIDKNIEKSKGNYLHLFIQAGDSGAVVLSYGSNMPSSIRFTLVPSGRQEQYLVRISSQWAWMNDQVDRITIRPTVPVVLSRVLIREGD